MWKAVLAGTAALAIAGSSLVYAQSRPGAPEFRRFSAEDISAFTDARIAALKAGLKLSAEQEKNWPAVEQAIRDFAKERGEQRTRWRAEQRPTDPIERMRRRADAMTQTAAGLKKLADAAQPLYQSLDEGQKQRFIMLARVMGPRDGGAHWRGFHHRGPDRGPGPGPERGPAPPQ